MMKEIIGKKVYKIVNETMITDKVYTIEKVKSYDKTQDWCQHYILNDGTEIREVDVVEVPNDTLEEDEKICQFLKDNECYTDEVYTNGPIIAVRIDGDWKHSHGWCNVLMGYLGYKFICERVTEEDGSDWYESVHLYKKSA